MSNRAITALKFLVHPLCLAPLALLTWRFFFAQEQLGADPVNSITHFTGDWTLYLLFTCLAITPLRRLSQKLGWLIRFRRLIGLYAFFYATLHLATYVWLYSGFNVPSMVDDVLRGRFITVGLLGWLLLLLLTLTSPLWVLKKMGGKRWQLLHRAVYVAAIAGVIHFWWLVKAGVRTPWKVTVVLAVLLLARVAWTWMQAAKKRYREGKISRTVRQTA